MIRNTISTARPTPDALSMQGVKCMNIIEYCEDIDIENGEWIYWGENRVNLKVGLFETSKKNMFADVTDMREHLTISRNSVGYAAD